ncbi:RraA family protein [Pseudonocardia sp. RS010]|uniref:RraA family protein n=1 Tax=Pseudonocardia sp. RS010 TaxID=3385979 RepID=UPI0039A28323
MTTLTDTDILGQLASYDTCAISDALDFLDRPGAVHGVRPLWDCDKIVGRARTVSVVPRAESETGTSHLATEAIATAEPGDIMVMANHGRLDVSCWGDIVTHAARRRGISGVVIDGACRDIGASTALGFPVYGRAVVPISARGRIVQQSYNEPVDFAGVRVAAGDYILADACGVTFVPPDLIVEVLRLGALIVERERQMIEAVQGGASVVDVMHDSQFAAIVK